MEEEYRKPSDSEAQKINNNEMSKDRLLEILGAKIVEVVNKVIDSCDKNLTATNQFRLDAMKSESNTKKNIFYIYLFSIFGLCALFIILAIVSVIYNKDSFVLPIITGVFGFLGGIFINKQQGK